MIGFIPSQLPAIWQLVSKLIGDGDSRTETSPSYPLPGLNGNAIHGPVQQLCR